MKKKEAKKVTSVRLSQETLDTTALYGKMNNQSIAEVIEEALSLFLRVKNAPGVLDVINIHLISSVEETVKEEIEKKISKDLEELKESLSILSELMFKKQGISKEDVERQSLIYKGIIDSQY